MCPMKCSVCGGLIAEDQSVRSLFFEKKIGGWGGGWGAFFYLVTSVSFFCSVPASQRRFAFITFHFVLAV